MNGWSNTRSHLTCRVVGVVDYARLFQPHAGRVDQPTTLSRTACYAFHAGYSTHFLVLRLCVVLGNNGRMREYFQGIVRCCVVKQHLHARCYSRRMMQWLFVHGCAHPPSSGSCRVLCGTGNIHDSYCQVSSEIRTIATEDSIVDFANGCTNQHFVSVLDEQLDLVLQSPAHCIELHLRVLYLGRERSVISLLRESIQFVLTAARKNPIR